MVDHDETIARSRSDDVKRILGILDQFDRADVERAAARLGLGAPEIFPVAFRSPSALASLPLANLEDVVEKVKQLLNDPSQLVSGPRSTGDRATVVTRWKESCRTTLDQDPDKEIPLTSNRLEWHVWDHIIDGEITAFVTLTWESDRCNIYNADFSLTVQRNDEPEDYGIIMTETYTIPATTPLERYVCHPCTPTCIRALASVTTYVLSATTGIPKGVSKKVDIDVLLCPAGATDNTNYAQSQGDANGPKSPLPPPVLPHSTNTKTWGVSKVDKTSTDPKKQYFPRPP